MLSPPRMRNESGASNETPRGTKRKRSDTLIPDGCKLTREQIVDLPIDEFNDLLQKGLQDGRFTEAECAEFR